MKHILPLLFTVFIGVLSNAQTIEVTATAATASQTIANGTTFDATFGGFVTDLKPYLPVSVAIKNSGSSPLILNATGGKYISLTGPGATDFTVNESALTGTIPAGQTQTFTVNLSSSATNGTKTVTMHINSNDAVNGTYTGSIKYSFTSVATSVMTAQELGVSLYPNPSADGYFVIQGTINIQKIVVSNVNGVKEEFYTKEFLTNLKGLLMVQLYTDKGIVSDKVLVQ